jgi:hypothetical protein
VIDIDETPTQSIESGHAIVRKRDRSAPEETTPSAGLPRYQEVVGSDGVSSPDELPLIYRVPLRSGKPGVDHAKQVAYARKHGVAGPGWGVGGPPTTNTKEVLRRLRKGPRSGYNTVLRFEAAPTGSYVWSRDMNGRYLLGVLAGEWEYDASPDAEEVDLQNFRRVRWARRSLLDDEVPAAVVRAFSGRGSSFTQIHSEFARMMSPRLYAQLKGRKPEPLRLTPAVVVRELLHPLDVEDLVFAFLQIVHDYIVLPGSHLPSTPAYEQVLISRRNGRRAIVQVKTGGTPVKLGQLRKAAADDARAFAYSTTGRYVGKREGIHIISEQRLLKFMNEQPQFLPARLRRLLEWTRTEQTPKARLPSVRTPSG